MTWLLYYALALPLSKWQVQLRHRFSGTLCYVHLLDLLPLSVLSKLDTKLYLYVSTYITQDDSVPSQCLRFVLHIWRYTNLVQTLDISCLRMTVKHLRFFATSFSRCIMQTMGTQIWLTLFQTSKKNRTIFS